MKRWLLAITFLFIVRALSAEEGIVPSSVSGSGGAEFTLGEQTGGGMAPDFSLSDLEGNPFRLSDVSGKVVLLDFWATWCPPCQEEIPHFVDLQNQYGSQGLQIVGIALDRQGLRVVKPFAEKYKVNYKILVGDYSKVVDDYGGIVGIPTLFVIDRKGKIVEKYIGYVEKAQIEDQIKKLL